jgi:hypothetical protein
MKSRFAMLFAGINLLLVVLFLALAPAALASSNWYVDGVHGTDNNDCKSPQHACKTIGHAISLASSGDSITVAAATYRENLSIGLSLQIVGASAATTIIDGGGVNTVVTVSKSVLVSLSNMTIRNGFATIGGGGIYNNGTLTINNSTVKGNRAKSGGGGICNNFSLTINNSTINGNRAQGTVYSAGGAIYNFGRLAINNSTLSGNSAIVGGGIFNHDGGTLRINNSTLSGNSTGSGGGGNIYSDRTSTLQNSIVANKHGQGNCSGTFNGIQSNGYNLSSDNTCNFNNIGDLNNTDPMLGPLQNNGGPTQTMGLLPGSPAIDSGNPNGCTDNLGHLLITDQRGSPRPDKEDSVGCDRGAYESQTD